MWCTSAPGSATTRRSWRTWWARAAGSRPSNSTAASPSGLRRISPGSRKVRVLQGDGAQIAFDPADVIYVNAGATRPADIWLDRLNDGGRLVLPLTSDKGFGEN